MPNKQEWLEAYRKDIPVLENVEDNKLWSAIQSDHGIDNIGNHVSSSIISLTSEPLNEPPSSLGQKLSSISKAPILSQPEKDFGITQGMKDMMGGEFKGILAPIKPDAIYKGMQLDPTGEVGDFPIFDVIKEGHPLQGSTISAKTLVQNNLTPGIPDIGEKIKSMAASGASTEELENTIQEIQNVHSSIAQEARLGFGQMLQNGIKGILSSGFSGAIIPPFLDEIVQKGMNQRNQSLGGT